MERQHEEHRCQVVAQPGSSIQTENQFLCIQDLCRYLGIKTSTLYVMVEERTIPHYRVGRLIRFKRSEIDLWMESNKKECPEVPKAARRILRTAKTPARDIKGVVKKAIDDLKGIAYTASHGKPEKIEDLGKGESDV